MNKPFKFAPHWRFFKANQKYLLTGKLRTKRGNKPLSDHVIPENFASVCVATAQNPATDDYIISQLKSLKIRRVRLDFTYGDQHNHVARFLNSLISESFEISLHLIQPLSSATRMDDDAEKNTWKQFVIDVCEQYGQHLSFIEIGTTINRKRWAGYSLTRFLTAWNIAYPEIKNRNIVIAGPNITDFEPIYNIGILAILAHRQQLPDIHTNNLFSERCTEPERDDHKILGHRLAPLAGFRLVKKAFVLQSIGEYFGVEKLHSPSAFWTLPRIERSLPDGEQKQADYLSRYMLLCAASGALESAAWGPLICHREGLIDDDVIQYPKLERITHYLDVSENTDSYRNRPAFDAYAAFIQCIPGLRYACQLDIRDHLEAHAFAGDGYQLHVIWTTNGAAAALADIYTDAQLGQASFTGRDGNALNDVPSLATESPIYIRFDTDEQVHINPDAQTIPSLSIHKHVDGLAHHLYRQNGWRGIVLAADKKSLGLMVDALNPKNLNIPQKSQTLRKARNAIWTIPDPRDAGKKLVVKQPVKMHLHKQWLDRFKPSKAMRSWNGASELLRRGIHNAQPIAYIEKPGSLMENYYICEYVDALCSVRDVFSAFANGEHTYKGLNSETLYPALCNYLFEMHSRGVFFRDLSGGNILIVKDANDQISFSLIDTARAHFFNRKIAISKRLSDLARACNKLDAKNRDAFMSLYMAKMGRKFTLRTKLPFYLYNLKVSIKRNTKRKNLIKLLKK